ncbi:MAG: cupin domain-containing protein [Chloroflexi bacterium]|nr:cupin domain-containing protein [Chloroflexota bacterium]
MPMTTGDMELTTYEKWQKEEGIPVYKGYHVPSLRTVELKPWARVGGNGCFINLADQEEDDARVMEIAPGGNLEPERHMFEEVTLVVFGRGATTMWQPGRPKQTVEWNEGTVFATPLNSWHQHFNADGLNPARLMSVTSAPLVINLFHNDDFIFNNDFVFADRYNAEDDYFSGQGRALGKAGRYWKTNFIPDARTFKLVGWKERGAGGTNVTFTLAANAMGCHISEFPVGTYKKGHRHQAGAHIVIIAGAGYSLMWKEGGPKQRFDWEVGTMMSPPDMVYHQHFNNGATPTRYFAVHWNSPEFKRFGAWQRQFDNTGGQQIEYEDEDPDIRELFESELAKVGVQMMLPKVEYRKK